MSDNKTLDTVVKAAGTGLILALSACTATGKLPAVAEASAVVVEQEKKEAPAEYEKAGLGKWWHAQQQRESGNPRIGWDYEEDIWRGGLGRDRQRLTLRGNLLLATDIQSLSGAVKYERELLRNLRGKNSLRLTFLLQNINENYQRGDSPDLRVDVRRALLEIANYWDLKPLVLKTGIGGRFMKWYSDGGYAPDKINMSMLGVDLGIWHPESGLTGIVQYYPAIGDYDFLGLTKDLQGYDLFAVLNWNIPRSDWFTGVEFQRTVKDYEDVMKTTDERTTLYGGVENLPFVDRLALGLTHFSRDNSTGDDYSRFGGELRGKWYLGREKQGSVTLGIIAREPTPENKSAGNIVEAGIRAGVAVNF